jgi:hypothetical protein
MKSDKVDLPEKYPKEGELYRHYKGDHYRVKALALHSNDGIWMVVYEPMYDNPVASFFTRPLAEWYDLCAQEDVKEKVQRFIRIVP